MASALALRLPLSTPFTAGVTHCRVTADFLHGLFYDRALHHPKYEWGDQAWMATRGRGNAHDGPISVYLVGVAANLSELTTY